MNDPGSGRRHDPVYLTDFRVATGEIRALDDLTDADVVAHRDALRAAGMTGAAVASARSVTLAAQALDAAPLPDEISAIVYATDDFGATSPADLLATLLTSVRRPRVPAFLVTGNGCANVGPALQSAAALCRGAPVVVVTADRALSDQRVLTENMSLLGDGAGACTVTTAPVDRCFELVASRSVMRAVPPGPRRETAVLRDTLDGVGEATRAALDGAGWAPGDLSGMLVGAYSSSARRLLGAASRVPTQIDLPDARAGHCHSADLFRGLAGLVGEDRLAAGDRVLALASGPTSWTVFALRHTRATPS